MCDDFFYIFVSMISLLSYPFKLLFNTELTADDEKQPIIRPLHCLDTIYLHHCRSVALYSLSVQSD